jgi:fibronectin type 3 domain-containing protein
MDKITFFILLNLLVIGTFTVSAQSGQRNSELEEELYIFTRDDGSVHVFNGANLGLEYGFYTDRRLSGEDWEQLNELPVYPASNGVEFMNRVEDWYEVLQEMTSRESPQGVFLTLMNRRDQNIMASFLFPDVAHALGRVFVDEEAPIGEEAEYRIRLVDREGNETGKVISDRVQLTPQVPAAPFNVTAENEGDQIRVNWYYNEGTTQTDGVIQFFILNEREGIVERLNSRGILRFGDTNSFSYQITADEMETDYNLFVVAVDVTGQQSEPSDEYQIRVVDNIPPAPVLNISATRLNEESVELSWPMSTDPEAVGYHLFRTEGDSDDYERITDEQLNLFQTFYVDDTIEGGKQYRYRLRVYDQNDNESEPSNLATITVERFERPNPVSDFSAFLNENQTVGLSWEDSDRPSLNTYVVIRKQINPVEGSYSQINPAELHDFSMTDNGFAGEGFTEGVTYRYGISVSDRSGLQSDTLFTDVHVPLVSPPAQPNEVVVRQAEGNRMNIRWSASSSQTVTGYEVSRITGDEDEDEVLGRTRRGNRFMRDRDLMPGFEYQYQVVAIDSAGNRSTPLLSDIVLFKDITPPPSVRNIQVREIDSDVHLRWEKVMTDNLAGYKIYKNSTPNGTPSLVADVESGINEWIDEDGSAGVWYLIRAYDTFGNESRSSRFVQAR